MAEDVVLNALVSECKRYPYTLSKEMVADAAMVCRMLMTTNHPDIPNHIRKQFYDAQEHLRRIEETL